MTERNTSSPAPPPPPSMLPLLMRRFRNLRAAIAACLARELSTPDGAHDGSAEGVLTIGRRTDETPRRRSDQEPS